MNNLDIELKKLSEYRLREILDELIILEMPKLSQLAQKVKQDKAIPRQVFENTIVLTVARQGSSYVLMPYLLDEMSFLFLKKSPICIISTSRDIMTSRLGKIKGVELILLRRNI